MAKKDGRNLNITINPPEEKQTEVVISFSAIFRQLKRFFVLWLVLALIAGSVAIAIGALKTRVAKPPVKALVSFTYKGIEKGLDPKGREFDINTIKTPIIIERALGELNIDAEKLETIRQGITFDGVIPEDSIDRITAYKKVYETANSGNLAAAQAMLDVTYYPTQFKVSFDYNASGLTNQQAADVLNEILDKYRDYFYENYGFNQSLGTAVPAVNYNDYDYSEQIDIFKDTLQTVEKYLKSLSNEDTTLFRSAQTGFTFNDLYRAAQTIESIDLDRISSIISVNNITKDKEASVAYCNYRIDDLTRTSTSLKERLDTIEDSIEKYEKDTILIFGNGTDGNDTSYSQASEEYDKLINQRVVTATDLADTKQKIKFYESRRSALQNNKIGSKNLMESVEKQLTELGDKVKQLVETTELTSKEYYENVEYKDSYNVLVPAAASTVSSIRHSIKNAVFPCLFAEAALFAIYIFAAFIYAIYEQVQGKKVKADGKDDDDDDDDDSVDIGDVIDKIEEAVESKK